MMSDWECLEQAVKGDQSAWKLLFETHSQRLFKMIFLIAGSYEAAQDILQDTFLELFHKQARHSRGSFKAYISTIAYHAALKEKRGQYRRLSIDDVEIADKNKTAIEKILSEEKDRILLKIINGLDESYRDILVLRFYGNHSYKEIAEITSLPLGTVKSRIFYAVKACREILIREGIER